MSAERDAQPASGLALVPGSVAPARAHGGSRLRFGAPLFVWIDPQAPARGMHRLDTVDDALTALLSEAFRGSRFDADGRERADWVLARNALQRAGTAPTPDRVERARSRVRTLAARSGLLVTPRVLGAATS